MYHFPPTCDARITSSDSVGQRSGSRCTRRVHRSANVPIEPSTSAASRTDSPRGAEQRSADVGGHHSAIRGSRQLGHKRPRDP